MYKRQVKKDASSSDQNTQEVSDRMLYMMLNESVQCLAENVVNDTDSLDMGMIFGTGFPPFLGGPMQYMRSQGLENCETRLAELEEKFGDRFAAKPGWKGLSI